MYECETCGYQTKRSFNFNLHTNRKVPCKPKVKKEDNHNVEYNVEFNHNPNHNIDFKNPNVEFQKNPNLNGDPTHQNVDKAGLYWSSEMCTGVSKALICPVCFKVFNTRAAKSQHRNKKVKCVPRVRPLENDPKICKRLMEDIKLKDVENDLIKKENEMLTKVIENNRLKNMNEALKKKIETLEIKPKQKRSFVNQVNRYQIAASQKWCCRICTELLPGVFHIDHTIPLKFGGGDNLENVTAVCVQCHALKTHDDLDPVTV